MDVLSFQLLLAGAVALGDQVVVVRAETGLRLAIGLGDAGAYIIGRVLEHVLQGVKLRFGLGKALRELGDLVLTFSVFLLKETNAVLVFLVLNLMLNALIFLEEGLVLRLLDFLDE